MGSLDGKVALVTGAASGIGRGIARRYVKEGARVVAADISFDGVEALAAELGPNVVPIHTDVSSWKDNQAAVELARTAFGRLDIFVGNAGIYDHGVALRSLRGEDLPAAFDELYSINVKGYLLGVRAALDSLVESRGCVILTASFASFSSAGGGVLYTGSKHAVVGLVRQLAYELAPDIRVNGVAPGVAPTRLKGVASLGQVPKDAVLDGTEAALPLGVIPDSDSYGGLYAFLASTEDAGNITGSIFNADSGLAVRGF
ncbi:SDR family oxidoreductase [Burkholderia aenigmatica]|uniref:SDR family oxidoreductase n=1 Tax=Burkholderia cepacia complex TaxID=87882 RepID=UPI001C24D391|nr:MULTISPECIES: SDR family oxidoreductase [Burkholderia cepacia complex]HDR8923040.1 SDR family oxidoreductase [Burkholderia vietnamiensis]MBU9445228.1 SDR family oxidoreductase [Burkholderia multivorans]MCA8222100.1 SDR family oxidoreductase [Burkholderia multivorans]UKD17553.1 SDR family oxidoreductase [Burkholderia aenigmatica]HDR8980662.1 SDR family oxidoreductase [Burkholderia vietnamiensis]